MGKETISRTTFVKGLTAGVVVAASLGILCVGEYTIGGGSDPRANGPASGVPENTASAALTETKPSSETSGEAAEASTGDALSASAAVTVASPGTYTAASKGISSDVTVTATFDENGITEITADVSGETAGIGAEIGEPMISKAMAAQSSEIDGIAGATITSNAFRTALADCMSQAGFTIEESAVEAEEASAPSEAASSDLGAAADAPFIPGTYTATAKGYDSDILVNVTFDENNIIAIGTYLAEEDADTGAVIGPEITRQILEAQSGDVDGISGATVTSDAVLSAFADCVAQAKEPASSAVSIIGGADGPTSIFIAGKLEDETEAESETESEAEKESETEPETEEESDTEVQTESDTTEESETEPASEKKA